MPESLLITPGLDTFASGAATFSLRCQGLRVINVEASRLITLCTWGVAVAGLGQSRAVGSALVLLQHQLVWNTLLIASRFSTSLMYAGSGLLPL